MSEIFPNNSDAKYDGESSSSCSSSPSHSPPPPQSRDHPQNGQGSVLAREISRKDKPTTNGHSKYINYEMKETSTRFNGNKEVQSSKDPDLIRDVKLSKDFTKTATNNISQHQQPQQQQTNRYVNRQHVFINSQRVNEGEDDKMNEHTSGNWLQEAKLKLRKSFSNPVETSNGVSHVSTSHVSVVSTQENGKATKIADDGRSEKQKPKENGHANGDGPTVTKGHRVFVSGTSKPMNGHADECANSHVNNNHVVTNEDIGDSKRVNNNNGQLPSATKSTVRPRVSFDGEVYVNDRRHSMDSVETESEEEAEEVYEKSQSYQSNVSSSSLEKNKSKSTSNLDDDETIEAPWFRDLKYQKMSSRMKANKKMAKSSINLRWSSTNGEPLVVPVASHSSHQCCNAPANSSEVKIVSNNRNNSSQMMTDDKEKVSINIVNKSGNKLENQTTKVVINGCSRLRHGPRPPLITTGVIPQRLTSVRNAEHVTNQCSVRTSHLCRNPVNDNVVIIGKNNGSNAVAEGERTSLSHDRYATHCESSQKKQHKAECSIDTQRQCCNYDTEARLPKEELIRRSLIDWDSLDRPKNSLTAEGSNRSSWLREVKLRKTTSSSTGDLLEDHDSRNNNNNNNMAVSPSESGDCNTSRNERYVSSPGLSSTLFLDSEGTDDDVSNARSIDAGLIKLQVAAEKRATTAAKSAAEESELDSDLGGSIRFGDESGSDDWRRNSFYESETWRKLEQSLQQVHRMKNGDDGHPEWVKEAERKKHSWLSLNNLNVESGSYSTNGVSDVKPSWLDEVNQKRSSSSNATAARSAPINQSSVQSRATYSLGEQDLPKIEIVEKGNAAAIDDDTNTNVSRVCVRVNGGTGWTYVTSTPTIHVIERNQVSPNSLDLNSSLDDEISEVHSSSTVKSSDHDNDFRRQIQVDHSNFNVEHYVRDLISRRRTEGVKRPSVDTPTPPSCSPDWLQRSLQTQRNLIDWNSLERLNCSSDGHDGAVLESVTLRKVPKVRKIMTEETRIIAALKPVNRRPQGSTSSDQSDEWADAVEHHETKPSNNASFDMDDEDRREPKEDEDVFSDKCLKVKGESELRQVANTIRSGSVDWTQLESGRGASRSEAPWVTEIQLRPSSRSPTPISQSQALALTSQPKRITSVVMPCIRNHGKQTNGDSSCITDDEIDEDEEELGRKLRTGTKLELPATKKVTFCIPNASGTTENKEDPEWIKLAEAKCKKTIKWEDLEKHEPTPKATSSTTTWITQVHLKHVPVSLETIDVPIPQREDDVQQPRIKVNLRHVASPTQTEVKMDDRDKRPSTIEADDVVRSGGNDVDGHFHVKNGHQQQLKSPQPDVGGQVKEEPDWLKVARQKKQVYVDWEQLGSSKKSSLPGDRPLPVIKEDNQPVNGFSSSNSSNSDHAEQTNGFSKPHWQSEGKLKNGVDGKSTTSDSPYRTWVVNKQRASRSATQNVALRWQSDPQLNTAPASTTPGWFKLAEKKRNSVADWSTIERSPSPVSTMSSSWMQEVRLRTPSPTPSPQPELEDDSKCTSPFPVQLRHVEEKLKPALLELDERNSPWISRSNSAEIDKWQIRYRELFEDLSDEPSPTEDTGTVNAFFDDYHVPLAPPTATICYPQQTPQTRSNSSSPRKLRNVNGDSNRQRRRLDSHHRYYSLPEMSAIPRSANELEIVHLNGSESPLSVDERPPTIPESPTSDENDIQEEKLIPFIRLRPTEKKETTRDTSPSREVEPFWLKEIKLRKVAIKETEELQSKLSRCLSDELREDERRSPSNVPLDFSYPRIPRTCSAPSHISSSLTIREAIHRDLKLEVARREQMKAKVVSNGSDKIDDNSLYTSVTPSPPPPNVQPQVNGSASTANRHKTEATIILTTENAVEQDDESAYQKKPVWLEELQQKKISLKHTETDHPVDRSPKRSLTQPETPSFQNVLEEIKNKGREKLFSSLRPRRKDNRSEDQVEPQKYLNSSGSSESSTPVSVLSDEDSVSSTQGSTTAFTISENSDSDFAIVIHDDDDDFLLRRNSNHSQDVKCKRFRPVSAPITVNHILQQHSQQLIDSNRFASMKNGNSPVREEPKLKILEEIESQEEVTLQETTPTLPNADLNGICEDRTDQSAADIDDQDVPAEDPDETKSKASLEDLKSPLLLLNLLSRFSKSCSETNLTALGAPSAKSRFEAATSRMTSSCSNLVSPAANKHGFHQFDDMSWSSGASVVAARSCSHTCNSSINELVATVASSSSASDLEVYEEAESESYENCKSQFSLQLRTSTVNSAITNSDRHDSEISLD